MEVMISQYVLACPNCSPNEATGDDFLHHFAVTIHRRSEEDAPTETINIEDPAPCYWREPGSPEIPVMGNPSWRRDGIRIWFECELCDQTSCMCIWQHKGQTYMDIESQEEIRKTAPNQNPTD